MRPLRALVVGIGRYREMSPAWQTTGPALAALEVARWLTALPDVDLSLDLFLDEGVELGAALSVPMPGLRVHRQTDKTSLETFVYKTLKAGDGPQSDLFVYWSGHGATCTRTRDRIFMCGDYDSDIRSRILNASQLLALLQTPDYRCYTRQLVLADTCGSHVESWSDQPHPPEESPQGLQQLVFFAALEGESVKPFDGGGQFTQTSLQILRRHGGLPDDLRLLRDALSVALEAADCHPYRVEVRGGGQASTVPIGDTAAPYLAGVLGALQPAPRYDDFWPHYRRTVVSLGSPAPAPGSSLVSALRDLCDRADAHEGYAPEALLQFMLRLEQLPKLQPQVQAWLAQECQGQEKRLTPLRRQLAAERAQKTLLIEVLAKGPQITGIRPYYCDAEAQLILEPALLPIACRGWAEFERAVQATIAPLTVEGRLVDHRLQFAVEAPLLDLPFHRIPLVPGGEALGTMVPLVVRHGARLLRPGWALERRWHEAARWLDQHPGNGPYWQQVRMQGAIARQPAACIAGFAVPHPGDAAAGSVGEKLRLSKLLDGGTPLLYIRHAAPEGDDWARVAEGLEKMTRLPARVDGLADEFCTARLYGEPDAAEATLLWDDPQFNPLSAARGVNDSLEP